MAKRVPKTSRAKTEASRRQADLRRRKRQRAPRKPTLLEMAKARRRAVRRYRHLKQVLPTEREAAEQAAREHSTTASTLRRWDRLHHHGGLKALLPKSKVPKTIRYRIPMWVRGVVVLLRVRFGWGQHRISAELKRRGIYSLSHKSVRKILDRQQGVTVKVYHPRAKRNGIDYRRWGRSLPNALWHIDFKGPIRLENGCDAYVLVMVDARSRYCVACVAQEGDFNTEQTQKVCWQAFEQFGLCNEMVSDNAPVFTSRYEDGLTRFSRWLGNLGIDHLRTTSYYPECNGKAEAFIKILKRELLVRCTFTDLTDLQAALDRYVDYYNHYRGHGRLGWQAPVCRYVGQAPQVAGVTDIPGLEDVVIPSLENTKVQPPPEVNAYRVAAMRALVPVAA